MNNLPQDLFGDDEQDQERQPTKKSRRIVSAAEETMLQKQTQLALDPLFSDEKPAQENKVNVEAETQIAKRYKVIKILGKGGMGVVYKVLDQELNHEVALKMLLPQQNSMEAKQRFFQEARSMAKLRHENIVAVHDIGEHKGNPYFTMDLIPGKELIDSLDGVKPRKIMEWMLKVCQAIQSIHEQGLIHRDLKPSNIMIANDSPVLMDFGIVKDAASDAQLTMEGRSIGTPAYMAPEQARGITSEINQQTDVYGLGAILYEALTKNPPFSGAPMQVIFRVCTTDPKPIKEYNPNLPSDLVAIVEKAMAKDKKFRYATAADLAKDIQRYLEGMRIEAKPVPPAVKWWRNARRNPRFIYGSAAAIILFIVGISGIWFYQNQAKAGVSSQIKNLLAKAQEEEIRCNDQTPIAAFWQISDIYTQVLALDSENLVAQKGKFQTMLKMAQQAVKFRDYDLARALYQLALTMENETKNIHEEIKKINELEQSEKQKLQQDIDKIFEQLSKK